MSGRPLLLAALLLLPACPWQQQLEECRRDLAEARSQVAAAAGRAAVAENRCNALEVALAYDLMNGQSIVMASFHGQIAIALCETQRERYPYAQLYGSNFPTYCTQRR